MFQDVIFIRSLGLQSYEYIDHAMKQFTNQRDNTTPDEIWLVEHFPVFTQGRKNKLKNNLIVINNDIPIMKSDRGGKITYHGPGQQIMYILLNLKRRKLNVRKLITILEETVINTLAEFNIESYSRTDAPGIYINHHMKICSLGLCIRRSCSLYGLALNINMDLSPFLRINPCGYVGMKITQMSELVSNTTPDIVRPYLVDKFLKLLKNPPHLYISI